MVLLSPNHLPHKNSPLAKTTQSPSLQFGAESNTLPSIPSEVPTKKMRKRDILWAAIFGLGFFAPAIPAGKLENLPSSIQTRKVGETTRQLQMSLPKPGATNAQPMDPQLFKNYLREIQANYNPSQDVSQLAEYNQLLANLTPEEQATTQEIFTKANKISFFNKKAVLSLYTEWLDKVVQPKTSPEFTAKLKNDASTLVSDANVNSNLAMAFGLTSVALFLLLSLSIAGMANKLYFNPSVFELQQKSLSPEDRGITEGALLKTSLPEMNQPKNLLALYGDWVDKVILPKTSPERPEALKKQAVELSDKAVSATYPTQNLDAPLFLSFLMMISLGETNSSSFEEQVKRNEKEQNEFVLISGLRYLSKGFIGYRKFLNTVFESVHDTQSKKADTPPPAQEKTP